jgi:hypothetical protein
VRLSVCLRQEEKIDEKSKMSDMWCRGDFQLAPSEEKHKEKIQDKRKEKCFWSYSAMPYVI